MTVLWRGVLAAALAMFFTSGYAQQTVRPQPLKSGLDFTGPEVRELQHDDFANPGMLWISRGETLWQEAAGRDGKSCAACHGEAKTTSTTVSAPSSRSAANAASRRSRSSTNRRNCWRSPRTSRSSRAGCR